MKKSNLWIGWAYFGAGWVFLIASGILEYSSLGPVCAGLAGAGLASGGRMLHQYFYWNAPENRERYAAKLEEDEIMKEDERLQMLRGRAAYRVYGLTQIALSLCCVVFGVLGLLGILKEYKLLVLFCGISYMVEAVAYDWIYRSMDWKY